MTPSPPESDAASLLARELADRGAGECCLALVLGSGLGALADEVEQPTIIDARDLEHLPGSTVEGHAGRIVVGTLHGVRVLIQAGRIHLYEGWNARQVTRAVRAFARLGIRGVWLTNAAGCMRRDWSAGGFMRITDQLNLQGAAALQAGEGCRGTIYSPALGQLLDSAATELGLDWQCGVYAGLRGPSYETPAEIRMLQGLGADAVGMSTVAEAAAARSAGLEVLGLSCLTNYAAGIEEEPLAHADVVQAGDRAAQCFRELSALALPKMANYLSQILTR